MGIGLLLCLMSLCYRRRYYNTAGRTTYSTGGPTAVITNTSVPMQAVPVGGYGGSQPMQAIPVQYAQYPSPSQPAAYNPYGSTYAQTPVGGGQPINQQLAARSTAACLFGPIPARRRMTFNIRPSLVSMTVSERSRTVVKACIG